MSLADFHQSLPHIASCCSPPAAFNVAPLLVTEHCRVALKYVSNVEECQSFLLTSGCPQVRIMGWKRTPLHFHCCSCGRPVHVERTSMTLLAVNINRLAQRAGTGVEDHIWQIHLGTRTQGIVIVMVHILPSPSTFKVEPQHANYPCPNFLRLLPQRIFKEQQFFLHRST